MRYHIAIDISPVQRRTVCDLYSNLVTRPTGATVRRAIEDALAEQSLPNVTVIDFSHVTLLDFSCADEIVGKLLDGAREKPALRSYYMIRGLHAAHLEAIEAVLERYDLAVIVEDDTGEVKLVGTLDDGARQVWHHVRQAGRVVPGDLEEAMGVPADLCSRGLSELSARRLVMQREDGAVALPFAS